MDNKLVGILSLPSSLEKDQSAKLFFGNLAENSWIHAFLKGISAMRNVASSRIWTRFTDSISYNDNRFAKRAHYTTYVHRWDVSRNETWKKRKEIFKV